MGLLVLSMFNLGNFLFNTQPGKIFQSSVRWASTKAGGSSKNRKGHAPGKRRGLKAQDGESVTINSILLRQLGVRCHPGLNVSAFFKQSLKQELHFYEQSC